MPKPEHIDALARALHASGDCWCESTSPLTTEHWTDARMLWVAQAGAVLARITNDPAVQDAVLAALVEGGRLVEEAWTYIDGGRAIGHRLVESEWRGATP